MARSPIAERLTAQALSGPPLSRPEDVAERLLAIQGQDPRGARLAIRARTSGLTAADVDRALTKDRSLLITWLNRGTLHLIRSEDYSLLQALTTPPLLTSSARRLRQEGVSAEVAERGVETIERSLADEGPLARAQLRERLDSAGVPTEGQALVQLLFLTTLRGIAVRGPIAGREHAYVLVRDWLGPQKPVDREAGLADLAKRAPAEPLPPPRLLGAFDPLLLGWASREEIVGPHKMLVTTNGIFRPFALVGGRAVATWRLAGGKLTIEPLDRVTKKAMTALEVDAAEVERFIASGWACPRSASTEPGTGVPGDLTASRASLLHEGAVATPIPLASRPWRWSRV